MSRQLRNNPVVFRSTRSGRRLKMYNIKNYLVTKNDEKKIENDVKKNDSVSKTNRLLNNHMIKEYFNEVVVADAAYSCSKDDLLKNHYNNSPIVPYILDMFLCGEERLVSNFVMYHLPDDVLLNILHECDNNFDAMMKANFAWWRIMRIVMNLMPDDDKKRLKHFDLFHEDWDSLEDIDKMFPTEHMYPATINHRFPPVHYEYFWNNIIHREVCIDFKTKYLFFYTYKEEVSKRTIHPSDDLYNQIVHESKYPPKFITRNFIVMVDETEHDLDRYYGTVTVSFDKNELNSKSQLKFDIESIDSDYSEDLEYDSDNYFMSDSDSSECKCACECKCNIIYYLQKCKCLYKCTCAV